MQSEILVIFHEKITNTTLFQDRTLTLVRVEFNHEITEQHHILQNGEYLGQTGSLLPSSQPK